MGLRERDTAVIDVELVRLARFMGRITQRDLARQLGVSQWRYSRLEAGVSPFRPAEASNLRRLLPWLRRLEEGIR